MRKFNVSSIHVHPEVMIEIYPNRQRRSFSNEILCYHWLPRYKFKKFSLKPSKKTEVLINYNFHSIDWESATGEQKNFL